MSTSDPLAVYKSKRNFSISPEPETGGEANPAARAFVIQKHWATRLHYDFRLELDGSMKSWAIPKGPSLDPREKRMAVQVEDHPIAYNTFEGEIPPKQYGAGRVIIWDRGTWVPLGDPRQAYQQGNLKFELHGHKLHGRWALIRMKTKADKKEAWLLIKEKDGHARPAEEYSVVDALPDSVASQPPPSAQENKSSDVRSHARSSSPQLPAGAVEAPLPAKLTPQLATLADTPPGNPDDWIHEIKFDGYRLLARIGKQSIHLFTRNGHDWSHKLQPLVQALKKMDLAPGWLDGEIVVPDARGIPDFQALQNAFDEARADALVYYLFDVPFYAGFDLRSVPLIERKHFLAALLGPSRSDAIRYSETHVAPARDMLASACRMGLEGIIAKRRDSAYVSRRSSDWLKLKCTQRQEFVIGGYTDPQGTRSGIGALLLGVYDSDGGLSYAGKVGTGFDRKTLNDLKKRLTALARATRPFSARTSMDGKAYWVSPKLVAEVAFGEWTRTGHVRHGVFQGLRLDKAAQSVVRETPQAVAPARALPRGVNISHPDRVIDASTGTTKRDVVAFYHRVSGLLMDHLKGRPVSLVRAPDGIAGPLFFQKHVESAQMQGIKPLDPALDPGHAPLLEVARPAGLLAAAQMNVLEFHTWNAHRSNIGKPDRMTFDLDPGEGTDWTQVQEAAHLLRAFLSQLGLLSFIKTSGGKGLHIVVPLKRLHDWDAVKGFSQAIVQHMAATLPQRFASKSGPRNRVGRIFIDYLRNGFGATTVAAWSLRARPGLGVSVPIEWSELDMLTHAAHWTLANIDSRLAIGNAPWKAYPTSIQGLHGAMKTLGYAAQKT